MDVYKCSTARKPLTPIETTFVQFFQYINHNLLNIFFHTPIFYFKYIGIQGIYLLLKLFDYWELYKNILSNY